MESVIVIGVDTGVGKSAICGGLLKMLHGSRKVCYWKPIQTGTLVSEDTKMLKSSLGLPADTFLTPSYTYPEPLSPYMAGKKWSRPVEMSELVGVYQKARTAGTFVVIEGAGGILVPFNEKELQVDFIKKLKVPVILVSEDRMGAINQTLLTVNCAREAKIELLGVVLTRSRRTLGNAECIAEFGKIEILAEFDPTDNIATLIAQVGGNKRLRKLFGIPLLPD